MTLEEMEARIHALEVENAALRGQQRHYKDAYPGAAECGIRTETTDFSAFFSYVRRTLFGQEHREIRYKKQNRAPAVVERTKKTIDLTDKEYEYYKQFSIKLFRLLRETIDGWAGNG